MRAPEHPGRCLYLDYRRATWGWDGGAPEESSCRHPENKGGDCCEEECPYAKKEEEPPTHGDAYEAAMDAKYDAMREGD